MAPWCPLNSAGVPRDLPSGAGRAKQVFQPYWLDTMRRLSAERGFPTPSEVTYNMESAPGGALFVGSPEQVAEKTIRMHGHLQQHDRLRRLERDRAIKQAEWGRSPTAATTHPPNASKGSQDPASKNRSPFANTVVPPSHIHDCAITNDFVKHMKLTLR